MNKIKEDIGGYTNIFFFIKIVLLTVSSIYYTTRGVSNTTKVLLIIPPRGGDDIMSTPEYVTYLKELRNQIWRNLNNFLMTPEDYEHEVNRRASVDKELAFYGL